MTRALTQGIATRSVTPPAPVELLDGSRAFHIVVLQRKTDPHQLSLEDDFVLLSQYALQNKRERERADWLGDLRERTFVEIRTDRYTPAARG